MKNILIYRPFAARGFSLVELMIALLIGLIISIGVVQIFGATRATYQLDEGLARAQENGRFALEFLSQDIRHAGYLGCKRSNDFNGDPTNFLANPPTPKLPAQGIWAFEFSGTGIGSTYATPYTSPSNTLSGWSPTLTTAFVPNTNGGALPNTDVIAVQRMVPTPWRLTPPFITLNTVHLDPAFANNVRVNDVLLVSDCKDSAVFMVTGINTATGVINHAVGATTNRCGSWGGTFANAATPECPGPLFDVPRPGAMVGTMETVVFYVANDNTSGENRPTLFRNVINPTGAGATQPLVEGVENFQVLYGEDTVPPFDGPADRYVPANGITNPRGVVSVQLGIVVYGVNSTGSANDTEIDNDTHVIATTNIISPGDRRKRRAFNTTIQIRNRGN